MYFDDPTEDQTRKKIIDAVLTQAGWDLSNKNQVIEEFEISGAGKGKYIAEPRAGINPSGYSDYLLLDRAGEPLAIIEAKKTSRDPIAGQQQAIDYAEGIKQQSGKEVQIFLANGYEIHYWNYPGYNPGLVRGFFSQIDLERIRHQNQFRKNLNTI